MSDPFIGEIRMFGGNFPPTGNAQCDGQIMSIAQNTALFSLLGTLYGGNGQSTFGLPDLRGRAPMFWGQGPGLSDRVIGEQGGVESVTLTTGQIPAHNHQASGTTALGTTGSPSGATWATTGTARMPAPLYAPAPPPPATNVTMSPGALAQTGGQPHNNMPPYQAVTFIIALQGVFPSRG